MRDNSTAIIRFVQKCIWLYCNVGCHVFRACDFGFGSGSSFKKGLFTTLCGYVCKGQQGEIARIHRPPTNGKNRMKSFCEVGYANFRSNVFAAGKTISVNMHA